MFFGLPGDRNTWSFLTEDGWGEIEALGISHNWSGVIRE